MTKSSAARGPSAAATPVDPSAVTSPSVEVHEKIGGAVSNRTSAAWRSSSAARSSSAVLM
jgi:hypothetical protein